MDLAVDGAVKLTITQEGGSVIYFYPDGAGGYEAPPRVVGSLAHNADGTWTYNRCNRHTLQFSSTGQLISMADLNGYATTLSYSAGELATVTDEAGRTLTFTWSGGRIGSVSDSSSPARTVTFDYNTAGELQDYTDAAGNAWRFSYDTSHRLETMRRPRHAADPTPPVTTNVYDGSGRVTSQTDELNRTTTLDYTSIAGATKVTDPKGNVTVIGYEDGIRSYITRGGALRSRRRGPSRPTPTHSALPR
jgi:YD repeat-containing protein